MAAVILMLLSFNALGSSVKLAGLGVGAELSEPAGVTSIIIALMIGVSPGQLASGVTDRL